MKVLVPCHIIKLIKPDIWHVKLENTRHTEVYSQKIAIYLEKILDEARFLQYKNIKGPYI